MNKLVNYTLIRDFYVSRFDTDEDNLNKSKSYQQSVIYPFELVITFHDLSVQLRIFSQALKKFSSQLKNEFNEKNH